MICKGDRVEILPEYRDEGDERFTWVAVSDEDKGRLDISPIDIGLPILPVQTVRVEMVRKLIGRG
jgi:hypothetical protein